MNNLSLIIDKYNSAHNLSPLPVSNETDEDIFDDIYIVSDISDGMTYVFKNRKQYFSKILPLIRKDLLNMHGEIYLSKEELIDIGFGDYVKGNGLNDIEDLLDEASDIVNS